MTIWYNVGTATATNGSTAVTGALTAWLANVKPGDEFYFIADARGYEVASVEENTALTLATAYQGSTGSGKAYATKQISPLWNIVSELSVTVAQLLGLIGTTITSGEGAPSDDDGNDLDLYFRLDTSQLYKKESGTWVLKATFEGPQGAAGPSYQATSTTSLTIGTGSKSFTVQSGRGYTVGQRLRASDSSNSANYMEGVVTSYSSTTLVLNVDRTGGSGTIASWNINITGDAGPANSLAIGSVTASNPGANAEATITGAAPSQTLNLVLPRGATGPANSLSIGTVEQGSAAASITGDAPTQTLNLVLPKGDAATIEVGNVTTVDPGDPAVVTNVGTSSAAVFDFELPKGEPGAVGQTGPNSGLDYAWDDAITDSDPGSGNIRINSEDWDTGTYAFISKTGRNGEALGDVIANLTASDNPHKAHLRVFTLRDRSIYLEAEVQAAPTDSSSYWKIPLSGVVASSTMPTDADVMCVSIARTGNVGTGGTALGIKTPEEYGAVRDGSTDDFEAFEDALAALGAAGGGVLRMREGTYRIDLTASVMLEIPSNVTIEGAGDATVIDINGSGTKRLFDAPNSAMVCRNFKINVSGMSGGTLILWEPGNGGSGLLIDNVTVDGNVTYAAGLNWLVQGVLPALGEAFTGFKQINCRWREMTRAFFRQGTSGDTGTLRDFKWIGNTFDNFFRSPIALNSPYGIFDDVLIDGNSSTNNDSKTTGGSDHFHFGLGSASNVRCLNNRARGTGNGVHVEEKAVAVLIGANQIELTDTDATGIDVLDNNVGGSYVSPKNMQVIGNRVKGPGKATATGYGIELVNDGSGEGPVDEVVIQGNIVEGFARGISIDDDIQALIATGNIVIDCTHGIYSVDVAWPSVRENWIKDCTTGLYAANGGAWGPHDFTGVTTQAATSSGNIFAPLRVSDNVTSMRTFVEEFDRDFAAWTEYKGTDPQAKKEILSPAAPSLARLTTGDDAAASMAVNGIEIVGRRNWRPSDGKIILEARVRLVSAITGVHFFFGFTDNDASLEAPITIGASNALTTNATDAVGIVFDTAADTDNWWLVGVANNVDATAQNTGVAPVALTYETWRIEISTAGAATFYRNGAQIGSIMAGAVATTAILAPVFEAFSRTVGSRTQDIAYVIIQQVRN